MKIKNIKIRQLFALENNDFDIECFPAEKISIIYAFNGLGKTTLLRLIFGMSKNVKPILESIPFKSLELVFDNGKNISVEKPDPKAAEYIYRIDGKTADELLLAEMQKEFNVTTIFANKDYNRGISTFAKWVLKNGDTIWDSAVEYKQETKQNSSMFNDDTGAPNPIVKIEQALTDKLKDPAGRAKVEELRDILNKNFTMTFKHLEILDDKFMAVPDSEYPNDPVLPIHELSSGEIKLILMFYELLFETEPHSIVLLDEPESSLHVDWQKDLLQAVINCCKNNDIQIIVATHSPDVVEDYFTQLTPMLSKRYAAE